MCRCRVLPISNFCQTLKTAKHPNPILSPPGRKKNHENVPHVFCAENHWNCACVEIRKQKIERSVRRPLKYENRVRRILSSSYLNHLCIQTFLPWKILRNWSFFLPILSLASKKKDQIFVLWVTNFTSKKRKARSSILSPFEKKN